MPMRPGPLPRAFRPPRSARSSLPLGALLGRALLGGALLGGALALVGCLERPALDPLEGTAWSVVHYRDADGLPDAEAYGTVAFREDRLSADSCNDCRLAYAADDGVMRFGRAVCTERACAAGAQFEVGALLDAGGRARYALEDGGAVLRLDFQDGAVLTLRRLDPARAAQP